ncbi:MerR family transcriptional regulator [Dorea sp. D27]|uniref:MerR family transcriptional regulator n=1 Tax=Dorea sp. D27 TaxID=658665 RepID=UPI000673A8DD|nr:MerR family transcriptional regulator [Dorea sp. D27]
MTIKEVEQLVDMKKANIRYYEEEGLLAPGRNKENNYREYSMHDVEDLKKIKFLRVLGVPVKDIRKVKEGKVTVSEVIGARKSALQQEMAELSEARDLCDELIQRNDTFDNLDVTLMDMQNEFFKMRGVKIMRLDKVYRLEKYRNMCNRTWQMIFLIYYPAMLSLKFVLHYELPFWITLPMTVCALAAAAAVGAFDYKIAHYKAEITK